MNVEDTFRRHVEQQRIGELLLLLRELEWSGKDVVGQDFETFQCCPMCQADKYDGKHRKGCRLAACLHSD